jgi:predicted kinase
VAAAGRTGLLTLHVLCGLPFAGKTTLAAALARRLGAAIVSLDRINAERGLSGGLGIPAEEWARTHRQALGEVGRLLGQGTPVVLDDTSCFRFLRDDHRRIAAPHGAEVVVVHVEVRLETALARIRDNARTRARALVLEPVLRDTAARFEPPGEDERVVRFPEGADPEAWVAALPLA